MYIIPATPLDLGPWILSCRAVLAIISCLGFVVAYTLTVSMSVALVCMLNHTAIAQQSNNGLEQERQYALMQNTSTENQTDDGRPILVPDECGRRGGGEEDMEVRN